MDPATIVAGVSLAWNIFQSVKKRQYKKTLGAVVDGVELAAREGVINPKAAIQANAAAAGVSQVLDDVLDKRRYRRRARPRPRLSS